MILVRKLIWIRGIYIILQNIIRTAKKRLVLIGLTEAEILLTVVLESKGRGVYYPITAYPSDSQDITLYNVYKEVKNENKYQ